MNVLDAAYNVVHDHRGGVDALAPRLDKGSSTLSAEVSPTGNGKLGLLTAVKLTQVTGDLRILNSFAMECGCMVLPLPSLEVGPDAFHQLAGAAKEYGDFFSSAVAAAADAKVTANELLLVDRELGEMIASAQAVRTALAKMHEAGKPA